MPYLIANQQNHYRIQAVTKLPLLRRRQFEVIFLYENWFSLIKIQLEFPFN